MRIQINKETNEFSVILNDTCELFPTHEALVYDDNLTLLGGFGWVDDYSSLVLIIKELASKYDLEIIEKEGWFILTNEPRQDFCAEILKTSWNFMYCEVVPVTLTFKITKRGMVSALFSDNEKDVILPGIDYRFEFQCYCGLILEDAIEDYVFYLQLLYGTPVVYKYNSDKTLTIGFELSGKIPEPEVINFKEPVILTYEIDKLGFINAYFNNGKTNTVLPDVAYNKTIGCYSGYTYNSDMSVDKFIEYLKTLYGEPIECEFDSSHTTTISFEFRGGF